MSHETTSTVTVASGGVMTDEVGAVTGELELRSTCDDAGAATTLCRYVGADEWYTVTDAARPLADTDDRAAGLEAYHRDVLARCVPASS